MFSGMRPDWLKDRPRQADKVQAFQLVPAGLMVSLPISYSVRL